MLSVERDIGGVISSPIHLLRVRPAVLPRRRCATLGLRRAPVPSLCLARDEWFSVRHSTFRTRRRGSFRMLALACEMGVAGIVSKRRDGGPAPARRRSTPIAPIL